MGIRSGKATDSMLSILDLMGRALNDSQGLPEYHSLDRKHSGERPLV